jgi:hypothetical protein
MGALHHASTSRIKVPPDLGLKNLHQFRVHEFLNVGNVENNHPGVFQVPIEFGRELCFVGFLHDVDDVCPLNEFRGENIFGVMVETSRGTFEVRVC